MANMLRIRCPNLKCRLILNVPTTMRGKRVCCATCGEPLLVPSGKPQGTARPGSLASAGAKKG